MRRVRDKRRVTGTSDVSQPYLLSYRCKPSSIFTSSMGTKRSREGQYLGLHTKSDTNMTSSEPTGAFQAIFETFRNELDEHHDRRERIIKASRDITALSKKK